MSSLDLPGARMGAVNDDLVRVLSTTSVPEGEIARALLEDEGIPVLVKGEGSGPYRMGPVHLYVPAGLEVQARLALAGAVDAEESGPANADGPDQAAGESEQAIADEERGSA
jgi:hypothetical protein